MKNIFTFILATLITVSSFAQTANTGLTNKIKKKHPNNRNYSDINLRSTTVVKQRLDSVIQLNYDTITNKWIKYGKVTYYYDNNGNDTLGIGDTLNTKTLLWGHSGKTVYSFKSLGMDTLQVDYNWDTIHNQWTLSDKYKYYYNTQNNDSLTIYYQWDTTKWTPNTKTTYFYDKNNNDTLQFDSTWYTNKWYISDKINYLYNNKGNDTTTLSYNWDSANVWSIYDKDKSYFDANGNDTLDMDYNSGTPPGTALTYKYKNIYNLNYNANEAISGFNADNASGGPNGTYNNIPIEQIAYSYINNKWVYSYKDTLYYSPQNVTPVPTIIEQTDINVYPNPATDKITIAISGEYNNLNFELMDLQGIRVAQQSFNSNSQISLPNLASGLYLYKVLENNIPIKVGKLVIQQ